MKHRNIMIFGTSSNVGKSVISTGLCRVFKEDGYRVAPFKAQNIALNSYVTSCGCEIGRAQAVQAEACGLDPSPYMNPILIKPAGDQNSQIILNGKVFENLNTQDPLQIKENLKLEILKAYGHIRENYEVSVLEGAGSPAEINLKKNDLVNNGMADMADAPVILVGDIERGGVFASIYGTIMLLDEKERKRIKGVVINKFHGDVDLLKSGIEMLEELIGIPVLGVLPYTEMDIDAEDSLSDKFYKSNGNGEINISVVKLKHLSNSTDIDVLNNYSGVNLRYIRKSSELGHEDLIIIPGSKNTIKDLKELNEKGISKKIIELSKSGVVVFGICGGFQMLGEIISDPFGVETDSQEVQGMDLLKLKTILKAEKITVQYSGSLLNTKGILDGMSGIQVQGYEIHHGITFGDEEPILAQDNCIKGAVKENVLGTYIHGIFDNVDFTNRFLNKIREKKGLEIQELGVNLCEIRNREYDKLAKLIREHIDIEKLYEIMQLD